MAFDGKVQDVDIARQHEEIRLLITYNLSKFSIYQWKYGASSNTHYEQC